MTVRPVMWGGNKRFGPTKRQERLLTYITRDYTSLTVTLPDTTLVGKYVIPVIELEPIADCHFVL